MRSFSTRIGITMPLLLVFSTSLVAQPGGTDFEAGGDLMGTWIPDSLPGSGDYRGWAFHEELPPMTAWAQAKFAEARPTYGPNGVPGVASNDPVKDCFPPGTPRIYLHPHPIQIIQTPGRVLLLFEYDHLIRQIYTDGREHRTDLAPGWMGDSTGDWDGDALVAETLHFNEKTWIDHRGVPHSEDLRVLERFQRLDDDTLQIDITVEDAIAFSEPWTARRRYRKTDRPLREFICKDYTGAQNREVETPNREIAIIPDYGELLDYSGGTAGDYE